MYLIAYVYQFRWMFNFWSGRGIKKVKSPQNCGDLGKNILQYGAFLLNRKYLYFKVSEGFVSFSHTVGIFFLFESTTFTFTCCDNFVSKFICDSFTVAFAAIANQPFHAQGNLAIWAYFCRDLERSPSDTTAAHLYRWSNICQCFFPYFVPIFIGHRRNLIQSGIE